MRIAVGAALAIRQACHVGRVHAERGGLWVAPLLAPASIGWAQLSTLASLPTPVLSRKPGEPRHCGSATEGRRPTAE